MNHVSELTITALVITAAAVTKEEQLSFNLLKTLQTLTRQPAEHLLFSL